jgi:nucleoside 2-deoxyribosyltransferase
MTVYIAAPYPEREAAIGIMMMLEAAGIEVTSTWLRGLDEMNEEYARRDLTDVARADALVAWNPPGWWEKGTGGRHVEFGYALALGMPIILIGERSNIFHFLNTVTVVDLGDDLVAHIEAAMQKAVVRS